MADAQAEGLCSDGPWAGQGPRLVGGRGAMLDVLSCMHMFMHGCFWKHASNAASKVPDAPLLIC